jgi:hypothetical protein
LSRIDRGTDAKVDGALDRATSRTRRTDQIRRLAAGNPRRSIALLAATMLLGTAGISLAAPGGSFVGGADSTNNHNGLTKYGPISPENGFPDWYKDKNDVYLEGCLDARDPYCNAPPVPDPTQATDFKTNFPDEFFYMLADANLTAAGGNTVLAEYAIEGAFGAGAVADGDQMVFGRTRYRIRGGLSDKVTYKITNPYGVDYVKPDAGSTDLFVTEDMGATVGAFGAAFSGQVGPFLQWAPNPNDATDLPPKGYVGDPGTPHADTGSPYDTNFVKIEGTGIGGSPNANPCPGLTATTSPDCIYTADFSLTGKKSTRGGVQVARATYSRDATGGIQFDTMAESKASQDIIVQDTTAGATRAFPATKLVGAGERYFAHVAVKAGTAKPATVDVINNSDVPRTVKHVTLVDQVTGTAVFNTGAATDTTGKMTVNATSSDPTAALSLPDQAGAAVSDGTASYETNVPADTVTVSSDKGGSVVIPVTVTGTKATPSVALKADAGADQPNVTSGTTVTLDGGNSTGNIDSYSWSLATQSPTTAPTPALTQNGAKATFQATNTTGAAITYTYELQLTDAAAAATATDTVVVTVQPVAAPVAKITFGGAATVPATPLTVARNLPVTLDGSTSTNALTFNWTVVTPGVAFPQGTATDQPKLTFTFPNVDTMLVRLTVTRPGRTPSSTTVRLNGQVDGLAITKARFIPAGARWVITGTASSLTQNNVHVYSGVGAAPSREIGVSPVAADTTWAVDVRDSAIQLAQCQCVTVVSDRGASLQVDLEKQANLPAGTVPNVAPDAPRPAAAGARTTAAAGAVPLAGAVTRVAALAPANVTIAPTVAGGTIGSAGLALTVNVPQGITLLQVRVLATTGKPLYNGFQLVRAGSKTKIRIRSAKLRRSLKSGKRYQLEVRAGTTRANLGKPVVKQFRVKR